MIDCTRSMYGRAFLMLSLCSCGGLSTGGIDGSADGGVAGAEPRGAGGLARGGTAGSASGGSVGTQTGGSIGIQAGGSAGSQVGGSAGSQVGGGVGSFAGSRATDPYDPLLPGSSCSRYSSQILARRDASEQCALCDSESACPDLQELAAGSCASSVRCITQFCGCTGGECSESFCGCMDSCIREDLKSDCRRLWQRATDCVRQQCEGVCQ